MPSPLRFWGLRGEVYESVRAFPKQPKQDFLDVRAPHPRLTSLPFGNKNLSCFKRNNYVGRLEGGTEGGRRFSCKPMFLHILSVAIEKRSG